MKCENCGEELEEGQKFCGNCGKKLPKHVQAVSRKKRLPLILMIVGALLLIIAVVLYFTFFSESAPVSKNV